MDRFIYVVILFIITQMLIRKNGISIPRRLFLGGCQRKVILEPIGQKQQKKVLILHIMAQMKIVPMLYIG